MNDYASPALAVPHKASFRDPAGCIFTARGTLYRQVNRSYQAHYDHLMTSGLYEALQRVELLVPHSEVDISPALANAYKILQPLPLPFISYPYEWSFSQLKDAALCTLDIQTKALRFGMVLKDASAYNIQFHEGKALLIDTLSFRRYEEGAPWEAYRQFCQHFLAPLALMSHTDVRLSQLLKVYIDGIPIDLASRLLPRSSWLSAGLLMHIHLHAKMQMRHSERGKSLSGGDVRKPRINKTGLLGIIDSLRNTILKLEWLPKGTEWANYYQSTNYSDSSFEEKSRVVREYLEQIQPRTIWDLGANTGHFSQLGRKTGAMTLSFDIDPGAVEIHYLSIKKRGDTSPLPLLMDLTNPSAGIGWDGAERDALANRGPADCIMSLALIHHLAISNNVPLERIAAFFAKLGHFLIIEFVPKSDSQVQRLLSSREDVFPDYTQEHFEQAFAKHFNVNAVHKVQGSERTLYLMKTHA